jgi:LuxR family maltose regulon positive regulatory protein
MKNQNYLLVKTKFSPPDFRSNLVQREDIRKTLDASIERKLTLICAPAGYGKTSLMAQYYQMLLASNYNVTWLSLDESDADRGRFYLYIIHAIRQVLPDFGDSLLAILQAGFSDFQDVILLNFDEAISTIEDPVYLFIDDFQLVESPELSGALKHILFSSDRVRLIISTRHKPQDLAIPRLRMLDEINEIDQDSLRFSLSESYAFFEHTLKMNIKPEHIRQLTDKTEGWAAGIQLASIFLRNNQDPDSFIKSFTGENSSVGEFIGDEIVSNLSEEVKEFLIKCSLLPRFNYKLCDHIFENKKSISIINELRESHLFIISLDNVDYWFRFHHLFAQFLRKKAYEQYEDYITSIHSKASQWYETQGFPTDAIEHAIEAGDHHHAAKILDRISADLFYQGKISVLESYAESLSNDAIRNHPSQQLDRIWQWMITWQFDKARIALSQVRTVLDSYKHNKETDSEEIKFLESKYSHREMSYAFFSDATQDAEHLAEHWLQHHINNDLSMVSSAKTMKMVAQRDRFILDDITANVNALHELHVQANFPYGVVKGDCLCGATLAMQGKLEAALDFFESAKTAAVQLHGEIAPLTAMPCLQLAEIYYEKNDIESAEKLVKKYLPLSMSFGFAENIIAGYLTKARIEFVKNQIKHTQATIESARKSAVTTGFERLRITMLSETIRQLLFSGDQKTAFSLARSFGISGGARNYMPTETCGRIHLLKAIVWSRINAEMMNPNNSIRVLSHWVKHLRSRGCTRESVKCAIILAEIFYTHEDVISGRRYLNYALEEAFNSGFCRSFPDEGPSLAPYIEQYNLAKSDDSKKQHIEKILSAYKKNNSQRAKKITVKPKPIIDVSEITLNEREIEIITLSMSDKSNSEIADALAITEGTVKWYWQNIYNKLGVRRRRQAAIMASDLGLLED